MIALESDEQLRVVIFESAVEGDRQYQAARDAASLPPDVEIAGGWDACMASITRPAAQEKLKALFDKGFHKPGDAENRLGFYVGQLGR